MPDTALPASPTAKPDANRLLSLRDQIEQAMNAADEADESALGAKLSGCLDWIDVRLERLRNH